MKLLKIFLACALLTMFCLTAKEEKKEFSETRLKELNLDTLNFDEIAKQEVDPAPLADFVKSELQKSLRSLTLVPYDQGFAFINGFNCHVASYLNYYNIPYSVVTVMEGPHYGMQIMRAWDGTLISINHNYVVEYNHKGLVFKHYYPDSKVITGLNQVIVLY